jgi:hypothetical protein
VLVVLGPDVANELIGDAAADSAFADLDDMQRPIAEAYLKALSELLQERAKRIAHH